jgi:phosphopantetheinyl transferase (holo-ACP synthase)
MKSGTMIRSVIHTVPIGECDDNRKSVLADFFTPEEAREMRDRPEQSVAGVLAAKRALVSLCAAIDTKRLFDEKSFVILHKNNGAPSIIKIPAVSSGGRVLTKDNFFISITHNRNDACGLAAVQEPEDD